jgi:preprotein translocase subunit SecE
VSSDKDGVQDDAAAEPEGGLSAGTDGTADIETTAASQAGDGGVAEIDGGDSADASQEVDPADADAEEAAATSFGGAGQGRNALDDLEPDDDIPADAIGEMATAGVAAGRVSAGSARAAARASAAATTRAPSTPTKGRATPSRDRGAGRGNIFQRLGRFLREVVAELRKVIWPTRREMITYSIVVVVFVSFMVALVWALDLLFAKSVLWIFG